MSKILNRLLFLLTFFLISVLILPLVVVASRAEGGQIDNFDIQPRTAKAGDSVRATLKVSLWGPEIRKFCGATASTLYWEVFETTSGNLKNYLNTGNVSFSKFMDGVSNDLSFNKTLPPVPQGSTSRPFYATIYCKDWVGLDRKDIATSGVVTLGVGTGGGGGGGGTCGGAGQPACAPGTTQTVPFSFDNPLQANNLVQLIDVITTWLFNIAIPIAVAMIVYAGVIFLISRGDTTKVTQAKKILLYAVVGLAIILIGKGFITLIESILNLGVTP